MRAVTVGRRNIPDDRILTLDHVTLDGQDFSGRRLLSFQGIESKLSRCRFENLQVEAACFGALLRPTTYLDCSFDRSDLTVDAAGRARFESH